MELHSQKREQPMLRRAMSTLEYHRQMATSKKTRGPPRRDMGTECTGPASAHGTHKPQPWHSLLLLHFAVMPSPLTRMKLTGRQLYLRLLLATMTADVFVNILYGKTD
ncbi:hypothetical protein CRENBAI_002663 [Crenichthys baileyi]|uniref:Uncharacterized protein n=1 Tax=Crenichthys baileyi TaxID=28760 RepID=A0AAV9QR18_9TELE